MRLLHAEPPPELTLADRWRTVAHELPLSALLGAELEISYLDEIRCVSCGARTRKGYGDGHCYVCFMESPYTAECVIRPALCRAHEGGGRDPEWERMHHDQPHYVYLALSSKYKVGVTRDWPQRWIDQGAQAIQLVAITPQRQLAGEIELALSEHYSDRTSWQRMLKGEVLADADLEGEVKRARSLLSPDLQVYTDVDFATLRFAYPSLESITKVKSVKLERERVLRGRLIGARGQYLIFEGGRVMNLRAHSGHQVRVAQVSPSE